jgi:dTDP-4-dehydrorhamnose reductase
MVIAVKLLVTGANGQVAQSLLGLNQAELEVIALGRPDLDITFRPSLERAIAVHRPDVVVSAAAYTAVDKAESEEDAAYGANRDGAANVAAAAAAANLPIIHLSTDYVFAGTKPVPYTETDPTDPKSVYGRSKLAGETSVLAANPASVILRTAWVYSPYGSNFLKTMLRLAGEREVLRVVADQHGTPTYAPDIAKAIVKVARYLAAHPDAEEWRGVFHMVASGETNWAGFAEEIFRQSAERGGPSSQVEAITTADYPTPAARPKHSRLDSARFRAVFQHMLPDWRDGVRRCLAALG